MKPSQRRPEPRPRRDIFERFERLEFIEGYGRMVREARERLGLTREELGAQIQEKATLIKKIENEEMRPPLQIARKLEKALRIRIVREISEEEEMLFTPPKTPEWRPTLGDMLRQKEEKEKQQ